MAQMRELKWEARAAGRKAIMKRTEVTYGQLGKVLRSLGFSCRVLNKEPATRVYEHKESGALITMPPLPMTDFVWEHHPVGARMILDWFGIANPRSSTPNSRRQAKVTF
jgi:hypothetical protein